MWLTFFHWGLHPWSIFLIVALALTYFSYRKGLPLTLRSILYPLIGDRIYGPIGHAVDILTVAITAFGISQTLGMGVIQINSGLNQVFGTSIGFGVQLLIIVVLCTCAVASVLSGWAGAFAGCRSGTWCCRCSWCWWCSTSALPAIFCTPSWKAWATTAARWWA
ncbi:BCCT family transporter [Oceanimonas sp. NS1]|nr:BCCT family transporter [Oceanimonas sp. NS1]